MSISDESEAVMTKKLRVTDFPHVIEAFDAGEISFHSGWVFHRAGANSTDQTRKGHDHHLYGQGHGAQKS